MVLSETQGLLLCWVVRGGIQWEVRRFRLDLSGILTLEPKRSVTADRTDIVPFSDGAAWLANCPTAHRREEAERKNGRTQERFMDPTISPRSQSRAMLQAPSLKAASQGLDVRKPN